MASKFEQAFAANRKAGKKEFSFGGKKYNTKLAASKPVAKPADRPGVKNPPVPADKPKRFEGMADTRKSISMSPTMGSKDDTITPVVLKDSIFPSEFSNKVKAAKERKSTAMNNMGSKVGLGSMGKSPKELPAPPSKAIVDQYGLGKKIK